MKNTDQLHELIHALSKAEKRHFKMTASRYAKSENNYLLLFDAIDQQYSYDEAKLKQKFKNKSLGQNIGKTKYLLYQLVLKSLRPLQDTKTIKNQLDGILNSVEFLLTKNLYSQALSLLQKAKKQAIHFQLHPYYLKVLSYEKKLLGYNPKKSTSKDIANFILEFEKVSSNTRIEMRYEASVQKVHLISLMSHSATWQSTLNEELNMLPIENFNTAPTFRSKVFQKELFAFDAIANKEYFKAIELYRSIYWLWKNNEHLIEVFENDFERNMQYFIQLLQEEEVYDLELTKVFHFIKKHQLASANSGDLKKQLKEAIMEFMLQLTKGNTELSSLQMLFIQDNQSSIEKFFSIPMQVNLYYHAAIHSLQKMEFSETLDWITKAKDLKAHGIYPRNNRFLKLMELIAHYELGEYEYLASTIRNRYRSLQKQDHKNRIENLILKSVRRLINTPQKEETNAIFFNLYESLLEINTSTKKINSLQTNLLYHWITNNLPKEKQERY